MYRNGEGVDVSATKMLEYLKQATTGPEPHVEALSLLGDMYYYGTSITDVDFVTALDYYKRAGQLGDGDSLCKTVRSQHTVWI
jgi:TPR repeat protein